MRYVIIVMLSVIMLSGCCIDAQQPAASDNVIDLTPYQLDDIRELTEDFNDKSISAGCGYYIWYTFAGLSDDEIVQRNAVLTDNMGLLPICIIIQSDNYITVVSDVCEAQKIANNLNGISTNLYTRVMFCIDDIAVSLLGGRVSVYDANKDIFARQ